MTNKATVTLPDSSTRTRSSARTYTHARAVVPADGVSWGKVAVSFHASRELADRPVPGAPKLAYLVIACD